MKEIRIPQNIWGKIQKHLFSDLGEHFAFLLAEVVKIDKKTIFLVNDIITISNEETEPEFFSLKLKLESILHVTNTANERKLALIEVHNHAAFGNSVAFSETDKRGFDEFVPYVLDVLPNRPYGALVLTEKNAVQGLMWQNPGKPESITFVKIIGKNYQKLESGNNSSYILDPNTFSRQISAFGKNGQKMIQNVKVGIVGVGGIGSHVVQQLTYLGVRDFVIVDPDLVESTNLNRLVGANPIDIGKPKIEVIKKMISAITNGKAKIKAIQKDLRSVEAFNELKQVDFIFGCVDNDGARLILNQLALSYLIHYIDCATGINLVKNRIETAGGHVMVVQPDGPCMESCTNLLDLKEVADTLTSKEEFENSKKLGYINSVNIKDPSVVSLNGAIASLTITKFMKLVTNLGSVATLTIYDMLEEAKPSVVPCHLTINEKCIHHSFIGIGDKIYLERYLKREKITLR